MWYEATIQVKQKGLLCELLRRYTCCIGLPKRLRVVGASLGADHGTTRLALLILALFYSGPATLLSAWRRAW